MATVGCQTNPVSFSGINPKEIVFPPKSVSAIETDYVGIDGHWRQSAGQIHGLMAVNAVHIDCYKSEQVCTESRASLSTSLDKFLIPPMISVMSQTYRILSWSNGSIVARDEAPVADIDVDRNGCLDQLGKEQLRQMHDGRE